MTIPTFEQVLAAARQLPPHDRARLVAVVVTELAPPPAQEPWSWATMDAFITDFHATYPDSDPAVQVMADRRAHA
jgi:hypothetical protein